MTAIDEFRMGMNRLRAEADADGRARKDAMLAIEKLVAFYRSLSDAERTPADTVVGEWSLADDESVRFDAQALIREFRIRSAVPSLRQSLQLLDTRDDAPSRHERKKIEELIALLES